MSQRIENSKKLLLLVFFVVILIFRKLWRKTGYELLTKLWIHRLKDLGKEVYFYPKQRLLVFWDPHFKVIVYKLRVDDEIPRGMSKQDHKDRIESIYTALKKGKTSLKQIQKSVHTINFTNAIRLK